MTKIMKEESKKWGAITVLMGLGATLVAGALGWLFSTTIENKVTFAPIVQSLEKINKTLEESDARDARREIRNRKEHGLIVDRLNSVKVDLRSNKVQLRRVMDDCEKNTVKISDCENYHRVPVWNKGP